MSYVIEKDVPVAPESRGKEPKYPFARMEVKDSIFFSKDEVLRARNAAYMHGKNAGKVFSCRRVDGGYRIWRIA